LWLTEKKQFPDHFGGNDITIIKIREWTVAWQSWLMHPAFILETRAGMFSSCLRSILIFLLRKTVASINFNIELRSQHISPGFKSWHWQKIFSCSVCVTFEFKSLGC
jgi:hypothetical protein